jgi:hypothetical protein
MDGLSDSPRRVLFDDSLDGATNIDIALEPVRKEAHVEARWMNRQRTRDV